MAPRHLVVLSLGAGKQSSALALLLDLGLLEGFARPNLAVFADTQAEPSWVYDTVDWLEGKLSYPVIRTTFGDLGENTWRALRGEPVPERGQKKSGYIDIPVFSETGIGSRQCTAAYKISPIKKAIREWAHSGPPRLTVTQYIGISVNEAKRAKPSRDKWITNVFPLIEAGWNRQDCEEYLEREHPEFKVRRSSCYMCPYRSKADWQELKELEPELYDKALEMERAMAHHARGPWFLRSGGLEKAMQKMEEQERRQPSLLGPNPIPKEITTMSTAHLEKAAEALQTIRRLEQAGHPAEYIWAYVNTLHYCNKSETWAADFAEGYTHFMEDQRQEIRNNPPPVLQEVTRYQTPEQAAVSSGIFAKLTGRKIAEKYADAYAYAKTGRHSEAYCRAYGHAKSQDQSEDFAKGAGSQAEKDALRVSPAPAMAT